METLGIVTRNDLAKLLIQKGIARDKELANTILNERLDGVTDANIISMDIFNRIFIQPIFSSSFIEILHMIDTKS